MQDIYGGSIYINYAMMGTLIFQINIMLNTLWYSIETDSQSNIPYDYIISMTIYITLQVSPYCAVRNRYRKYYTVRREKLALRVVFAVVGNVLLIVLTCCRRSWQHFLIAGYRLTKNIMLVSLAGHDIIYSESGWP